MTVSSAPSTETTVTALFRQTLAPAGLVLGTFAQTSKPNSSPSSAVLWEFATPVESPYRPGPTNTTSPWDAFSMPDDGPTRTPMTSTV
jgi:hypothetical protein